MFILIFLFNNSSVSAFFYQLSLIILVLEMIIVIEGLIFKLTERIAGDGNLIRINSNGRIFLLFVKGNIYFLLNRKILRHKLKQIKFIKINLIR